VIEVAIRKTLRTFELDVKTTFGRGVSVLAGSSGAGKTTSFYMIVGLISPDSGRVFLDEEDITSLPMYQRARRGLSYLPQSASVFRKLSVEENLMAILETLQIGAHERRSCPSGEADDGDGMARKRLVPHHHEHADEPA